MEGNGARDQIVFSAVDGGKVSRLEMDQMATFLGTDTEDKLLFGGIWGPNFLNDGVVKRDFLETGLAQVLASEYPNEIKIDLQPRLEKEKKYTLYSHPQAKFLSVEGAWGYFAPDMKENYAILKKSVQAESPAAFDARVNLFLAEKNFPSPTLKQVLRYQERQYSWLSPDENLPRMDLSLFGYHTTEDWFGPRFMRLVSQFVINSAKIAEQKGYQVTSEEALVDLLRNAEISFKQNQSSPYLGVANSEEYFQEQLRRLSMDQTQAVKIWRQVLLFRRLFHEVGRSVFVDPKEYHAFDEYAKETAEGDLYRLPKDLWLSSYGELQKFEVYLDAVSKDRKNPLALPTQFLSVEEVEKNNPELVQKLYYLEFSEFNKKSLQGKVGIKETWNWEMDDKNWEALKKQFPELATKRGNSREERLEALDTVDEQTRKKVDAFAREAIIDSHPEWLKEGLAQAKPKKLVVGIRLQGKMPFAGLENGSELIKLLDAAPLNEEAAALSFYTADKNNYYRIKVIERDPKKRLLTFKEANADGTLEAILKKKLEADYVAIRDKNPQDFQKADKSWKDLKEVQDKVADHYFEKVLKAIKQYIEQEKLTQINNKNQNGEILAAFRLYPHLKEAKEKLAKNPENETLFVDEMKEPVFEESLMAGKTKLQDQWKLEKSPFQLDRSGSGTPGITNVREMFGLTLNEWSKVENYPNGEILFFQLKEKKSLVDTDEVAQKMEQVQSLLSDEAQRQLMKVVLEEIKQKKAMSVEYLNLNAS